MQQLGTMNKFILVGAAAVSAVIGGTIGYENYHTVGSAIFFGLIGPAAVYFGTLHAVG